MCVCVFVCVYVCVCVCMHAGMCACMCVCMCEIEAKMSRKKSVTQVEVLKAFGLDNDSSDSAQDLSSDKESYDSDGDFLV